MTKWTGWIVAAVALAVLAGGLMYAANHTAEVRISARQLDDGRVEFALQQRVDGEWGERILPPSRYFPANVGHSRWLNSTPLTVTLPEATSPVRAASVLTGQGDHVQAITLDAGVYYCDLSVSDNAAEYGGGRHFAVVFEGRDGGYELLANESETAWSARKKITVGDGWSDLRGVIDVEVTATGSWSISCARQG